MGALQFWTATSSTFRVRDLAVPYRLRANTNDGSWVFKRFKHLTGRPMLVTDSFDVRGEPIGRRWIVTLTNRSDA
jgi:hypothetical protein